jgi:hypothetical protein
MACNASVLAAVGSPWNDNSKEGKMTQSQSAGAVRGDMHRPPSKTGAVQFVENVRSKQCPDFIIQIFILSIEEPLKGAIPCPWYRFRNQGTLSGCVDRAGVL